MLDGGDSPDIKEVKISPIQLELSNMTKWAGIRLGDSFEPVSAHIRTVDPKNDESCQIVIKELTDKLPDWLFKPMDKVGEDTIGSAVPNGKEKEVKEILEKLFPADEDLKADLISLLHSPTTS